MRSHGTISILIVDDHQLVRDGLKLLLSTFDEFDVVGIADDGDVAIAQYQHLQPDVVLMDHAMPNMDGPEATERILQISPSARIIILTSFVADEMVQSAVSAGAIGYMLKNASPEQLARAIHSAHAGMPALDVKAVRALSNRSDKSTDRELDLTDRELQVLTLVVDGKTNKEIADALFISATTVRDHVSHILSKLDVNNRTEAAAMAVERKLLHK